jgi:hypothetical protein
MFKKIIEWFWELKQNWHFYNYMQKGGSNPTIDQYLNWVIPLEIQCKTCDHEYDLVWSCANGDTGYEDFECQHCGHYIHHIWY